MLNGLETTHSLATIITQPIKNDFLDPKPADPCLKKAEFKNVKLSNIEMQRYKGEKKRLIPSNYSSINILLLNGTKQFYFVEVRNVTSWQPL